MLRSPTLSNSHNKCTKQIKAYKYHWKRFCIKFVSEIAYGLLPRVPNIQESNITRKTFLWFSKSWNVVATPPPLHFLFFTPKFSLRCIKRDTYISKTSHDFMSHKISNHIEIHVRCFFCIFTPAYMMSQQKMLLSFDSFCILFNSLQLFNENIDDFIYFKQSIISVCKPLGRWCSKSIYCLTARSVWFQIPDLRVCALPSVPFWLLCFL